MSVTEYLRSSSLIITININDLDLEKIFNNTIPYTGGIELVQYHENIKYADKMFFRNSLHVDNYNNKTRRYYKDCIEFAYPFQTIKMRKNGEITIPYFKNSESTDKIIDYIFDILKVCGYDPKIINSLFIHHDI